MKHLVLAGLFLIIASSCQSVTNEKTPLPPISPGAWQTEEYLPLLKGKSVALVVNPTSTIHDTHLVDSLIALGIDIKVIFSPEHGFRGKADAGEKVDNSIDEATGIPIISLYGKHRKPTAEDLQDVDIIVFDIQGVGVRFYTFISTMHYIMEGSAENNKPLIILDRPNPNGNYIAGPVLDSNYQSFVGMHPIPIVYGLTMGELAQMINKEGWLASEKCDFTVIKNKNYSHKDTYELPVKPSPNLPNAKSIELYPYLCLFEPTSISIGRGTTYPFQVIGFPDSTYGDFSFTPVSIEGMSKYPKYEDQKCYGVDLREGENADNFSLSHLVNYYNKFGGGEAFFTSPSFFDKLAGSDNLRLQILAGKSATEIETSWSEALEDYKVLRKKYLLYDDFE
jgi:uncharacterized protein YbbC (DUF1343 family)